MSSAKGAQDVVCQIKAMPRSPEAICIQADANDPTVSARKIVAETIAKFGSIDIIINNAANGSDQSLEDVEHRIFDTMFHTNVLFPLLLIKESIPYLNKRGRIVNVSSSGSRSRQAPLSARDSCLLTVVSSHAIFHFIFSHQSRP